MRAQDTIGKLGFDEDELQRRRRYFEISDEDLARLAGLKDLAARHNDEIVEVFYRFILGHAESAAYFADATTVSRVKEKQRRYFLGLFAGRCDLAYAGDRARVGSAHESIKMPARLYLGAYAVYLRLIQDMLDKALPPAEAHAAFTSVQRLVMFDVSVAIDTYVAAAEATIVRHQAAVRELSTPVIRIFDKVLLLPLVGTIDTARAQQVMETLLVRVADEQARVVILDISGVPVVDTKVAENLIMTTNAVRLLGAETVLTGISPVVAKTIVQLGISLTNLETRGRLQDGIELALARLGCAIQPVLRAADPRA